MSLAVQWIYRENAMTYGDKYSISEKTWTAAYFPTSEYLSGAIICSKGISFIYHLYLSKQTAISNIFSLLETLFPHLFVYIMFFYSCPLLLHPSIFPPFTPIICLLEFHSSVHFAEQGVILLLSLINVCFANTNYLNQS